MSRKRSQFLDEIRVPKDDLRSKPKCPNCGVLVTRENFGMSKTAYVGSGSWNRIEYYCHECFLSPKAIS